MADGPAGCVRTDLVIIWFRALLARTVLHKQRTGEQAHTKQASHLSAKAVKHQSQMRRRVVSVELMGV